MKLKGGKQESSEGSEENDTSPGPGSSGFCLWIFLPVRLQRVCDQLSCPVHARLLQQDLPGQDWSTHGQRLPDAALVPHGVHVPSGWPLWLAHGVAHGQQLRPVKKGTLLINNLFSIAAAILMGTSELAKTFEVIILSRVVMGIFAGLASNVVPMFLGEMAPKNLRGAIGVVPQLFITIGILAAQILGLNSILGNAEGWPVLLGLTGIPSLLQLLTLPFFPESPRYLLIQKGNEKQARRALQRLRGREDVDDEIQEMYQEDQSEKEEGQFSVLSLFTFRGLRWQLISIIVMMAGQQLSGVNAVFYYADRIFESAGVPSSSIQYVTVSIGAINVVMTLLAVFIVESLGRRILLLAGFVLCSASCAILTLALNLQTTVSWMSYLSIVCVIAYIIGHAIGPSPIPAVMITEMFLQSSRPAAFMVGGSVHWLSNFTVGLVFLYMEAGLGPYSFLIFCAICVTTVLYIFFIVPETKNKTFMEINRIMAKRNKVEIQESKELTDSYPLQKQEEKKVLSSCEM
ncbi:PREDICTED: solute carrier family 2, facilitated glucose transporter member 5 isoform X2 [Pseudopodoces humilis]|uniref:solute carrier family 2, facilitated glucose transporter member 5 isoform X2 n=1 Tax=Pseudopodoces humilis TaxID=181119 RepID=UPI0006B6C0AF|nr:PREDICTED: solute carrier family 2, facilitated glucose transporter member 5 isoform X2 [Pseudopodoces humilis]